MAYCRLDAEKQIWNYFFQNSEFENAVCVRLIITSRPQTHRTAPSLQVYGNRLHPVLTHDIDMWSPYYFNPTWISNHIHWTPFFKGNQNVSCNVKNWYLNLWVIFFRYIYTNCVLVTNYHTFSAYIFSGEICYLNIKHERALTLQCCNTARGSTQEWEPAHTGWCLVIQPYKFAPYFKIWPWRN